MRSDLFDHTLIHEIDDRAEIARVAAQAIRHPCKDAIEFSETDVIDQPIEFWPLSRCFGRMALASDLSYEEPFSICNGEHLLYLRFDRKRLDVILFRTFSRIKAVANWRLNLDRLLRGDVLLGLNLLGHMGVMRHGQ